MTNTDDERIERARQLLPAWFVPRMMAATGNFAFLLPNGDIVHFNTLADVQQAPDGSLWLDVDLSTTTGSLDPKRDGRRHITSRTSRIRASINTAHVVLAFETTDT